MNVPIRRWACLITVVGLLIVQASGAVVATSEQRIKPESTHSESPHYAELNAEAQSIEELDYDIRFESNETVHVSVKNDLNRKVLAGLNVDVDGRELYEETYNLTAGEERNWSINVTPGLNVVDDNHTVTVGTYSEFEQFNFTRDLNPSNNGSIPRPHIERIKVTNGTIDGEPSAVAKVTISNPGIQLYSSVLMVHTEATNGSLYGASVPAGENETFTVELLDERGARVAGEARLYTENISQPDSALDQVEFVGQAERETTVWNTSYDAVRAPWLSDHYVYQNESIQTGADVKGEKDPGLSGTQLLYIGAGAVLLSGLLVKRRLS